MNAGNRPATTEEDPSTADAVRNCAVSCILIHDPHQASERWQRLLGISGRDIVICKDRNSLVTALAGRRPDVLIYVLHELERDLDLLFEVRRVAPTLPIILLEGPGDLATRRTIQELRPTYYGISPVESDELKEAVSDALSRGVPRQGANRGF
jgi:DNA-binding NtrC family response regulator